MTKEKKQIKFKNGMEYDGWMLGNMREGVGRQKWSDGALYDG